MNKFNLNFFKDWTINIYSIAAGSGFLGDDPSVQ